MSRLTTTATPLAVSADYADALLTARRAKNWLFLLLLLGILAQVTVFFLARFTDVMKLRPGGEVEIAMPRVDVDREPATTLPTTGQTPEVETRTTVSTRVERVAADPSLAGGVLAWVTNAITYLGTIFSIAMIVVVLLIVLIMLVGRLIGVAHTTSAFVWAVVLALLLFPWQLFYDRETARPGPSSASNEIRLDDYRWPGAFYTWGELRQGVDFDNGDTKVAILRYARFAAFPLVALVLLFMVQAKSGRGIKYALGEAEIHVDVTTGDV